MRITPQRLFLAACYLCLAFVLWQQVAPQASILPSLNRLAVVRDGPVTLSLYRDPSSGTCALVATAAQLVAGTLKQAGTHVAVTSYPCSGR
jgi:hypothetical protein